MRKKTAELLTVAVVLVGASTFAIARMGTNDLRTLPYQGTLEQDGAVANGDYLMRFGLFVTPPDANAAQCVAEDSCALWSEEQLVTVTNGRFSVLLGESDGDLTDQLLSNDTLHLVMAVKPAADPGVFSLLSGAQEIIPQPWAARAAGASNFRVSQTLTVDGATTLASMTATTATAINLNTSTLDVSGKADVGQLEVAAAGFIEMNNGDIRNVDDIETDTLAAAGAVQAGSVNASGELKGGTLSVSSGLPVTLSGDYADSAGLVPEFLNLQSTTRSACFLVRNVGACVIFVSGSTWQMQIGSNSACTARCISW